MAWLDGLDANGNLLQPPSSEDAVFPSGMVVLGTARAAGHQYYVMEWSKKDNKWSWGNWQVEADLTDDVSGGNVVRHDGGREVGGPRWTSTEDGSVVQCVLPPAGKGAEHDDKIRELLLYPTGPGGPGIMGSVLAVSRINTALGHPGPDPDPTKEGEEEGAQRIPYYEATYVFWGNEVPAVEQQEDARAHDEAHEAHEHSDHSEHEQGEHEAEDTSS